MTTTMRTESLRARRLCCYSICMFDFKDMNDYFTRWNNMLFVTTGCLSINPTAAMLSVVDEFIENKLMKK